MGLIAGAITSMGFVPQLIKGYKTKKLDDVSLYMPGIIAFGLTLWIMYGFLLKAVAIIIANAFGAICCIILIIMKIRYKKDKSTEE